MTIPSFALPGDTLAPSTSHTPGAGSHIFGSNITSSLAGPVTTTSTTTSTSKKTPTTTTPTKHPSISISPSHPHHTAAIPSVGDTILGRITRTTPRQATLDILALGPTGSTLLHEPFTALIRQQDIRATETDKVKVAESFRVGDIVRGVVVSLGDERSYFVGTAGNDLGVVFAVSERGVRMVPVSWREMREVLGDGDGDGTGLGESELRKVAKPV